MSEENKNLNTSTPETLEEQTKSEVTEQTAEAEGSKNNDSKKDKNKDKKKNNKKDKKNGGLKSFLKSRKAKHGSIAAAIVAVVVAITILINVVCGLLVDRFPNLKIDMTSNGAFELQQDTLDYMGKLDSEVNVYILATESSFENNGTYFVQAKNLLEKMVSASDGKLSVDYVDTSTNPNFASKYPNVSWDSSSNNIILVENGDQYKALTLDECFSYDSDYYSYYGTYQFTGTTIEQAIVTAILNVTTEDKVVVDMITGNGEQDYSAITKLLESNAYQVNEVSLATNGIDDDAKIVFLFAPSVDLDDSAIEKLSVWLDNDGNYGRTLIYVPCIDRVDTPNLDDFLDEWGLQVDDGYAFETSTSYLVSNSSPYAFITDYTSYYKDGLKNSNIPVLTSNAHDIIIKSDTDAHALLTTSTEAGVIPYEPEDDWSFEDGMTGSALNIAAEGVKTNSDETTSQLIVFGSYMMFADNVMSINSFNNSAYLMNVVNTVAEKEDVGITIEGKDLDSGELGITDITPGTIVLVVFVFVIPIAILVFGIITWLRRRNK